MCGGIVFRPGRHLRILLRPRPPLWLCPLVVLSIGLISSPGTAQSTAATGKPVAWGCRVSQWGQCTVPSGLSGVTALSAGFAHSLGLRGDGTVVAWGCGPGTDYGQCSVPSGLSGVTKIAAGGIHSLALKSDGTVVAWGCVGTTGGQCNVPSGLAGVTAIAGGSTHSLAAKSDGTVVAWGCGPGHNFGQCTVPPGLSGVTAVAAGQIHSLALKNDGTVVAWGCSQSSGQCSVPSGLSGVTAIAAGDAHSLALKGDGTVVAWGCGDIFNLGQCTVPSGLSGVTSIAAGYAQSVALKSDGTVVAWGCAQDSDDRQCTVPTGLAGATVIAAGIWHSLALISPVNQTITFGPLASKTYGDPAFDITATASSGLEVSFAATGPCAVAETTVRLSGAGSCSITASQPGNDYYNAAPDVTRAFTIAPMRCRVPKVVGKRLAAAKRTIARRHCRTGRVRHAYSRTHKRGLVISQNPRPGRSVPGRTKVNLVASRGRRR